MKTVEQKHRPTEETPPVYWADEIEVREAGGALNLSGMKQNPLNTLARDRDLMKGYLDALANATHKSGGDNTSPHVVFANCRGGTVDDNEALEAWDSALRKYVSSYGPVLAEPVSVQVSAVAGQYTVQAQQGGLWLSS